MLASNIKTVRTRFGNMSYYADDLFIGASLAMYGEYSQLEIDLLGQIIRPGWTVIDVGANIGVMTVAFAEMVGDGGTVYAYEPQVENFELLERNIGSHAHVQAEHKALGDHAGSIVCQPLGFIGNKNYGAVELSKDTAIGDRTELTRLDDEIYDPVHLIKIDVEGMEVEVLHGATELLKEHRPILYLENDRAHRSVELLNLLNDYGYTCFTHKPPMYNPNNYNLAPFSDRFNYVSANVLAIPQEKVHDYTSLVAKLRQSKIPSKPVLVDKRGWAGFARMGGVGDMLIAASVCRPLKELGYRVECISQEPMSCLFENNPLIDKLTIYTKDDWPKDQDSWQRWFAMRAKEYDRFANLSHSCEALHAAFPNMTQFWWPEHFRRKIFAGSYLESAHDLLNVPYTFGKLFWPTELEIEWAQEILQKIDQHPVVGWVVCGTRLDKVYPYQQQTIARLIKEVGVSVIMTGRGPDTPDYLIAEEIGKMVKAQNGTTDGLYRVGQATTKIRDVITLLQQCDLVIGPDTGPMWGVAFEAMPKIMLHSHASVENITKHWLNTVSLHADPKQVSCWPCHRLHNDTSTCRLNEYENGAACISNITPDLVLATARKLLGGRCARIPNFSAQSA